MSTRSNKKYQPTPGSLRAIEPSYIIDNQVAFKNVRFDSGKEFFTTQLESIDMLAKENKITSADGKPRPGLKALLMHPLFANSVINPLNKLCSTTYEKWYERTPTGLLTVLLCMSPRLHVATLDNGKEIYLGELFNYFFRRGAESRKDVEHMSELLTSVGEKGVGTDVRDLVDVLCDIILRPQVYGAVDAVEIFLRALQEGNYKNWLAREFMTTGYCFRYAVVALMKSTYPCMFMYALTKRLLGTDDVDVIFPATEPCQNKMALQAIFVVGFAASGHDLHLPARRNPEPDVPVPDWPAAIKIDFAWPDAPDKVDWLMHYMVSGSRRRVLRSTCLHQGFCVCEIPDLLDNNKAPPDTSIFKKKLNHPYFNADIRKLLHEWKRHETLTQKKRSSPPGKAPERTVKRRTEQITSNDDDLSKNGPDDDNFPVDDDDDDDETKAIDEDQDKEEEEDDEDQDKEDDEDEDETKEQDKTQEEIEEEEIDDVVLVCDECGKCLCQLGRIQNHPFPLKPGEVGTKRIDYKSDAFVNITGEYRSKRDLYIKRLRKHLGMWHEGTILPPVLHYRLIPGLQEHVERYNSGKSTDRQLLVDTVFKWIKRNRQDTLSEMKTKAYIPSKQKALMYDLFRDYLDYKNLA